MYVKIILCLLMLAATGQARNENRYWVRTRMWCSTNGIANPVTGARYEAYTDVFLGYDVIAPTNLFLSKYALDTITDAQVVAWQAAQDAAQANAAAMPATFPTGVAVPIPDADGHYMLLQPSGDGQPVVAIQISDSPIDPATWQARRDAKLAAIAADRAAKAQAYEARKATAQQTAQGAQNVPALRAAMADMQAQIDALRAIVEAGR